MRKCVWTELWGRTWGCASETLSGTLCVCVCLGNPQHCVFGIEQYAYKGQANNYNHVHYCVNLCVYARLLHQLWCSGRLIFCVYLVDWSLPYPVWLHSLMSSTGRGSMFCPLTTLWRGSLGELLNNTHIMALSKSFMNTLNCWYCIITCWYRIMVLYDIIIVH